MGIHATAQIVASRPLLAAGLKRLAWSADVDLVDDGDPADFVLRSSDEVVTDTPIDVTIANGMVVITISERPDPGVWEAVGRVVDHSLTTNGGSGR